MAKSKKPSNNAAADTAADIANDDTEIMDIGAKVAGGFEVVGHVSLPFLKMKDHVAYPLEITSPFKTGDPKMDKKDPTKQLVNDDGTPMKGPDSFNANLLINAATGAKKPVHCIANAAMRSEIERVCPNDSYVGRAFLIKSIGKVEGRRYKGYQIVEIAVPKASK